MKICTKCKQEKDEIEFAINTNHSIDGLHSHCRECRAKYFKLYNKNYLEANRKEVNYGITQLQYDNMVKECDSKCHICGKIAKLCVDHDHRTIGFRGLLCSNCNTVIGLMQDNPDLLKRAAEYLIERKPKFSLERLLRSLLRKKHDYD
jgi:hypothetical protein